MCDDRSRFAICCVSQADSLAHVKDTKYFCFCGRKLTAVGGEMSKFFPKVLSGVFYKCQSIKTYC